MAPNACLPTPRPAGHLHFEARIDGILHVLDAEKDPRIALRIVPLDVALEYEIRKRFLIDNQVSCPPRTASGLRLPRARRPALPLLHFQPVWSVPLNNSCQPCSFSWGVNSFSPATAAEAAHLPKIPTINRTRRTCMMLSSPDSRDLFTVCRLRLDP